MVADCELDMIPQMLEEGKMTKREAVMKVLKVVYTNPGRFNLLDMEEDERSDFLLASLPRFEKILERYDKSHGPIGAYIFYSMPGIRIYWTKKKSEEAAIQRAAKRSLGNIYEIEQDSINSAFGGKEEGALKIKDSGGENLEMPLLFKRVFGRRTNLLEPKSVFYKKRAAFVLALKSAWYIDDESVGKLSGYCGFSQECVFKAIHKIKKGLEERSVQRADLEARRDKAWYFVCKYREQLARMDPSSERFRQMTRKLEYQLKAWKKKTKLLQSCQMTLAPKNNELARMLKIKPYRISLLLSYAKKMVASGETLLSDQP